MKWVEQATFVAESGSGHAVVLDGAPEIGGRELGVRPMEMLLMGLGGCTAMDVIFILKRQRQPVADCVIEVEAERAPEPPKVFTRIHVHFKVAGEGLKPAQVERAVHLSAEKFCSASLMLGKACEITHSFEVIEGSSAGGAAGENS